MRKLSEKNLGVAAVGKLANTALLSAGLLAAGCHDVNEQVKGSLKVAEQQLNVNGEPRVLAALNGSIAEKPSRVMLHEGGEIYLITFITPHPELSPNPPRGSVGAINVVVRNEDGELVPITINGLETIVTGGELSTPASEFAAVVNGPDGNFILVWGDGGLLRLNSLELAPDGQSFNVLDGDNGFRSVLGNNDQPVSINDINVLDDGTIVASGGNGDDEIFRIRLDESDTAISEGVGEAELSRHIALYGLPDHVPGVGTFTADTNGLNPELRFFPNANQGLLTAMNSVLGNNGEPIGNILGSHPSAARTGENEITVTYVGIDGQVRQLTVPAGQPVEPPVDAEVSPDAAQDAGTPDAEVDAQEADAAADAEVSPADSEVDATVTDAAPADMSVSPDMAESDAEPDGGIIEPDSAIPDQGVDMAADRGVEQPPVCGDSICGIEESVNSCLVDCFKAFRMSEGECAVEVRLVDDGIVEFTGNGDVTDRCIAEIDVPGFADPVRYIVSFDPEGEPQAGRLEFEGIIFLGEDGAPEFGTALGRNLHTVIELEEDGQQWRVGNLDGLSLAGVATKIFLVKESETDGRQVWRATNNNTFIEGPVFAFDPKGNVVAVLPPAATIRFIVQDGGETVEIEAVEQGQPDTGIRIVGGAGCADADCDTNPEKGPTTPATPIALVLLALTRIPLRRRKP